MRYWVLERRYVRDWRGVGGKRLVWERAECRERQSWCGRSGGGLTMPTSATLRLCGHKSLFSIFLRTPIFLEGIVPMGNSSDFP